MRGGASGSAASGSNVVGACDSDDDEAPMAMDLSGPQGARIYLNRELLS